MTVRQLTATIGYNALTVLSVVCMGHLLIHTQRKSAAQSPVQITQTFTPLHSRSTTPPSPHCQSTSVHRTKSLHPSSYDMDHYTHIHSDFDQFLLHHKKLLAEEETLQQVHTPERVQDLVFVCEQRIIVYLESFHVLDACYVPGFYNTHILLFIAACKQVTSRCSALPTLLYEYFKAAPSDRLRKFICWWELTIQTPTSPLLACLGRSLQRLFAHVLDANFPNDGNLGDKKAGLVELCRRTLAQKVNTETELREAASGTAPTTTTTSTGMSAAHQPSALLADATSFVQSMQGAPAEEAQDSYHMVHAVPSCQY